MIKKIIVVFLVLFVAILVFNSCQSLGTAGSVAVSSKRAPKKGFRAALEAGDVEETIKYLESGVSLTETDAYGETPIFTAARYGHTDLIALLLVKGADPMAVNVFGECPAHVAAANGKKDAAALLSSLGGSIYIRDGFGMTPLQKAKENGFPELQDGFNSRVALMKRIYTKVEKNGTNLSLVSRYFAYRIFPVEKRGKKESWTAYVARSSKERLEEWLALEDKAFPPEIKEPETPPPIVLTQKKWETNKEFEDRVQAAGQERQKIIDGLQEEYRRQVEKRNKEVLALKKIQDDRISRISDYRSAFARFTMEELFTGAGFKEASLDKVTGDLFLDDVGFGSDSIGRFVVTNAGKELRKAAFQNPKSLDLEIVPFTDASGSFGIKKLTVKYGNESFSALPTGDTAGEQDVLTASIETKANYVVPQEQSLNFIDRNAVGEITYKDGTKAVTGFDDDLNLRISQLPNAPADNKKWAFVIGAEKYLNTDNIVYARRSAELFALTAQKVLGVPSSHLIALYDSEATGGNIKGKLKKLLEEGIAKGDTLYFYYNGHGVPNPVQGSSPYILPTDMDLDYISDEPFFDLRNLYAMFEKSKAGKIIVFLDSCFTGKTDGRSVYRGKAAPRLSPKKIDVPAGGNLAVLSAGTETQFSSAWPEKGQRLFTYFVIEALASGANRVDPLFREIYQNVSKTSREIGGALSFQDPTLQGNGGLEW